jgi:hypothetical protein
MRARLVERAQQGDDVAFGELVDLDGDLCGRIADNDPCATIEAFVLIDGRIHAFGVWRDQQDALFQAFLSTVHFTTGVSPSPSP